MSEVNKIDVDALETQEWLQALESVVREEAFVLLFVGTQS